MNRKKLWKYAAVLAIPAFLTLNGLLGKYDQTGLKGEEEIVSFVYNRKGEIKGFLPGVVNHVYGNATGGLVGFGNHVEGDATGGLLGLFNLANDLENAVQIGFYCRANKTSGPYLQLCVINVSDDRGTIVLNAGWK